jgi:hypothetical protein
MHDHYPAVPSLLSIGVKAVPGLMRRLGGGRLNEIARRNALRAVVLIYREEETLAITGLRKAAREAKGSDDAGRFVAAAKEAVELCSPGWRDRCRATLSDEDLE